MHPPKLTGRTFGTREMSTLAEVRPILEKRPIIDPLSRHSRRA